jgi:hypothetical protein
VSWFSNWTAFSGYKVKKALLIYRNMPAPAESTGMSPTSDAREGSDDDYSIDEPMVTWVDEADTIPAADFYKNNAAEGGTRRSPAWYEPLSPRTVREPIPEDLTMFQPDSGRKGKGRATESEVLQLEVGERIDRIKDAMSRNMITDDQSVVIHNSLRDIELELDI